MATTTTTSSTTTTTTTSKRYLSNFLTAEADSTLSNVTSIHTQLQSQSQSLYETQNSAQLKALDKHSALLQELHQRQLQTVPRSVTDAAASGGAAGGAAVAASGTKTATILVSKSKTKTGLPLLLKNSINNQANLPSRRHTETFCILCSLYTTRKPKERRNLNKHTHPRHAHITPTHRRLLCICILNVFPPTTKIDQYFIDYFEIESLCRGTFVAFKSKAIYRNSCAHLNKCNINKQT